jgi:hypothetical protein
VNLRVPTPGSRHRWQEAWFILVKGHRSAAADNDRAGAGSAPSGIRNTGVVSKLLTLGALAAATLVALVAALETSSGRTLRDHSCVLGVATLRRLVRRKNAPSDTHITNPLVGLLLSVADEGSDYPRIAFGIGCFHFGARPEMFSGSASEHIKQMRAWLAREPAISNIEIQNAGDGWFETALDYGLSNGGQPFPAIRGLRVDFDLRVNPDVQKRWRRWGVPDDPLDLRILIRQGSAVPVALSCRAFRFLARASR